MEDSVPVPQGVETAWREVLGDVPMSHDSNFFHLGGNSLRVALLVQKLRSRFDVQLTLQELLLTPTLEGQIAVVSEAQSASTRVATGLTQPVATANVTLAQSKRAMALRHGNAPYLRPVATCLEVQGNTSLRDLSAACVRLVEAHSSLRTTFVVDNGSVSSLVTKSDPTWRPKIASLAGATAGERRQEFLSVLRRHTEQVFDPSRSCVAAFEIAQIDSDRFLIGLVLDHLIADGHSIEIVERDLRALCDPAARDAALSLPSHGVDEQRLVAECEQLEQRNVEERIRKWRELLDGYPHPPAVPLSELGALRDVGPQQSVGVELSGGEAEGLSRRCQALGVSPATATLGLLNAALQLAAGVRDACFVVPRLRRDVPGSEEAVGWFAEAVIVRLTSVKLRECHCEGSLDRLMVAADKSMNSSSRISLPLPQVLRALNKPGTDPEQQWVFYNFSPKPADPIGASSLTWRRWDVGFGDGSAHFTGLRVVVEHDYKREFKATFTAAANVLNSPIVKRMFDEFENLLRSMNLGRSQPFAHVPGEHCPDT